MSASEKPFSRMLAVGAIGIGPLREVRAVLERAPEVRVGDEHAVAVPHEVELVDHPLVEQPDDVRARAHRVALVLERPLERARAPELLAALEHEHRLPGLRQVGRGRGSPLWPPPTSTASQVVLASSETGAGNPTLPNDAAIPLRE